MNLAVNLKSSWRLASVHGSALLAAIAAAQVADPACFDFLPERWRHIVTGAVALYTLVGRFIPQTTPAKTEAPLILDTRAPEPPNPIPLS